MKLSVLEDKGNGAYLAAAWIAFIESEDGKSLLSLPLIDEVYLQNRLWHAFMKGADEAVKGRGCIK